jgi:GTP-binding protein
VRKLKWKGPWFAVSAIAREGTWPVCLKIQDFFDRLKAEAVEEMRSEDA